MAVSLSPLGGAATQFFDNNGVILSGGKIYTYAAGTTTPQATYTSVSGATPHANPIILDSAGRVPGGEIWLTDTLVYKFVIETSTGSLLGSYDNIPGINDITLNASNVEYDPPFTGAVTSGYTVADKLSQTVSVKDFGAVGDGVADDTAEIQAALTSGAGEVIFPAGGTYLVDGGLLVTTVGQRISANGATIKLKASATTKYIIRSNAAYVVFDGGTYDGNKTNGNSSGSTFDSWSIAMYADNCTTQNVRSINQYGIGIKGFGNYLSVLYCRISNTENYGIFFDGSASVSHTGNRAIGNIIDMSEGQVSGGQNQGQGILFTAGAGQAQTAWELADNNIIGPQTSVQDQAINLGVRGNSGIVSNNTTRYGAMGFSEGGANTVITGNRFLNLVGTFRIGIEPSGKFTAIGNIVTDAYVGIDSTATTSYDESLVSGNQITIASGGANGVGVRFQIVSGQSGKNVTITGNSIDTPVHGVYVVRDCEGMSITGNTFVGPGIGSGRGVFLDTVQDAALISINGNTFNSFLRPWSVYSLAATVYTDLYAANNHCINCGSTQVNWPTEGIAVIGTRACVLGAQYGLRNTIDVATNVFFLYSTSFNNPEGLLTAGFGSTFVSLNSGGGMYRKNTGTGNTGWVAL